MPSRPFGYEALVSALQSGTCSSWRNFRGSASSQLARQLQLIRAEGSSNLYATDPRSSKLHRQFQLIHAGSLSGLYSVVWNSLCSLPRFWYPGWAVFYLDSSGWTLTFRCGRLLVCRRVVVLNIDFALRGSLTREDSV